jgi:hypothetical protein
MKQREISGQGQELTDPKIEIGVLEDLLPVSNAMNTDTRNEAKKSQLNAIWME